MSAPLRAHFSAIWEAIADATPDAPAVVQGARHIVWRDYEARAARLARAFLDAGLGAHSKVGMYLYNSPEYCETNFAAMKIRGIPVNVNYRYLDDELAYLLDNADAEAVVFHSSLGDRVARVRARVPKVRLLVEVDDGPAGDGSRHVDGAIPLRRAAADPDAGRAHPSAGRRDLHALHRRHDRHAEGRHVLDGGLHDVLPAHVPVDGRPAEDRRSGRAAGDGA
jgi:fatty-acyl-CoA synthase